MFSSLIVLFFLVSFVSCFRSDWEGTLGEGGKGESGRGVKGGVIIGDSGREN